YSSHPHLHSFPTRRSSDLTLIEDKNKLINTRLFNKVEIHLVEIDRFLVDLIIEVNERWYTFPIPILALSDRNFNDWIQNHDAKRSEEHTSELQSRENLVCR